MRTLLIGIIVGLLGAAPAWAKDVLYPACTADAQIVVLSAVFDDAILAEHPDVEEHVGMIFRRVARALSVQELLSVRGFELFADNLTAEDKQAMAPPLSPRVLEGSSCTVEAEGIRARVQE